MTRKRSRSDPSSTTPTSKINHDVNNPTQQVSSGAVIGTSNEEKVVGNNNNDSNNNDDETQQHQSTVTGTVQPATAMTTTISTMGGGPPPPPPPPCVIPENSLSVGGRCLPSLPNDYDESDVTTVGSILLFYQYKEPLWTESEFQRVLKEFIAIGQSHHMTGRGRIAREGVNCTFSGTSKNVRDFCQALRDWNTPLFDETDFKITDRIPRTQLFKSLSVRKTDELVAYGMELDKAPSLKDFGGTHLTAVDYHDALQDPNTVVIDVRNAYETAIGTMHPPPGGAQLLDPKLRNSHEWPKWLAAPETQKQLSGKKVLTFCTGGIRCERATALINQMAVTDTNFQPQGVYHMRGGIERYLKTYPQVGTRQGLSLGRDFVGC
jgi:predicted sulfurtransferase